MSETKDVADTRDEYLEHARLIADQVSFGNYEANALFIAEYLAGIKWANPGTPSERFAAWLNAGPRLAKEVGLYVGIKVEAKDYPPKAAKS